MSTPTVYPLKWGPVVRARLQSDSKRSQEAAAHGLGKSVGRVDGVAGPGIRLRTQLYNIYPTGTISHGPHGSAPFKDCLSERQGPVYIWMWVSDLWPAPPKHFYLLYAVYTFCVTVTCSMSFLSTKHKVDGLSPSFPLLCPFPSPSKESCAEWHSVYFITDLNLIQTLIDFFNILMQYFIPVFIFL